jgi:hypothetical protein
MIECEKEILQRFYTGTGWGGGITVVVPCNFLTGFMGEELKRGCPISRGFREKWGVGFR